MNKDRLELLAKIQKVEQKCIDLNLYLDTHPKDKKTLTEYNSYASQLMKLKNEYDATYAPLMNFGFSQSTYPFQWINDPWPWEI